MFGRSAIKGHSSEAPVMKHANNFCCATHTEPEHHKYRLEWKTCCQKIGKLRFIFVNFVGIVGRP